jgi:hypothetical protein
MAKLSHPYKACGACARYAIARRRVLKWHIAVHCVSTGESVPAVVDRFMAGVHARHLAGLPIMPTGYAGLGEVAR